MPHATPNPHDAEEILRPYLGRLHLAPDDADLIAFYAVEAFDKALELLGVRR